MSSETTDKLIFPGMTLFETTKKKKNFRFRLTSSLKKRKS